MFLPVQRSFYTFHTVILVTRPVCFLQVVSMIRSFSPLSRSSHHAVSEMSSLFAQRTRGLELRHYLCSRSSVKPGGSRGARHPVEDQEDLAGPAGVSDVDRSAHLEHVTYSRGVLGAPP